MPHGTKRSTGKYVVYSNDGNLSLLNAQNISLQAMLTGFLFSVTTLAQRGYVEVARVLLDNGADVNFQSSSGKTALMMASFSG